MAAALSEPVEVEGAEFHVSASLGVSVFPRLAAGGEELLRQADTAMYQAKRAGRAGHMVYTPEEQHPLDRLSLTARLRRSIDRGELELHYQPIYSTSSSGQPVAVEALLRWNDPSRGLVPPAAFIPAAEHSGLIEPIGEWVMDELCRQAAEWAELGLTPRLSVNAAPRELRRPRVRGRRSRAALERHGIEPGRVVVEVTESAAMDEAAARGPLERLHALGVGVAIDDFGEGFSSLSRLREMPVEQIKIDRSFMRDVPRSASASARGHRDHPAGPGARARGGGRGRGDRGAARLPDRPGMPDGPGLPPGAPAAGGRGDGAAAARPSSARTAATRTADRRSRTLCASRFTWSLPSASIT